MEREEDKEVERDTPRERERDIHTHTYRDTEKEGIREGKGGKDKERGEAYPQRERGWMDGWEV